MKALISLIAATISANAFATPADKVALSLNNVVVNNEKIESIEYHTCHFELNITSPYCKNKIVIKQVNKPNIESFLTSAEADLIDTKRSRFSSNTRSNIINFKNSNCKITDTTPILKTAYVIYENDINYKIHHVEENKTVLVDNGCPIRPESDKSYQDAIESRKILTDLAIQILDEKYLNEDDMNEDYLNEEDKDEDYLENYFHKNYNYLPDYN